MQSRRGVGRPTGRVGVGVGVGGGGDGGVAAPARPTTLMGAGGSRMCRVLLLHRRLRVLVAFVGGQVRRSSGSRSSCSMGVLVLVAGVGMKAVRGGMVKVRVLLPLRLCPWVRGAALQNDGVGRWL